jgi:hypothetical protein
MKKAMIIFLLATSVTFMGLTAITSAAEPSVSYYDLARWYWSKIKRGYAFKEWRKYPICGVNLNQGRKGV